MVAKTAIDIEPRLLDLCVDEFLTQSLWEIWQTVDQTRIRPSERAWMWTNWATWHAASGSNRQQSLSICIEQACTALTQHETMRYWGIRWEKLWRVAPNSSLLAQTAQRWLKHSQVQDIPEWNYVWRALIEAQRLPETINRDDLLVRGFAWLNGRDDRSEWSYMWQTLIEAERLPETINRDDLLVRGFAWLNGRDDRSEWSHVWETLFNIKQLPSVINRDNLLQQGYAWLDNHKDYSDWNYIWQALIKVSSSSQAIDQNNLLVRGFTWLNGRDDRSEWAHVWGKLITTPSLPETINRDDLLVRGFTWLNGRDDRSEWNYVWRALIEAQRLPETINRDDLLARGFAWLNGRDDRSEWSYMWQTLIEAERLPETINRDDLLVRGFTWLNGRDDRSEWNYVWRALIEVQRLPETINRDDLLARGFAWLNGRDDRSEWVYIWEMLYARRRYFDPETAKRLIYLGLNHLDKTKSEPDCEWGFMYEKILKDKYITYKFIELGSSWILSHPDCTNGYRLAENILKKPSRGQWVWDIDHPLVTWLAQWLVENYDNRSWGYVWEAVWKAAPSPRALTIFFDWLDTSYPKPSAVFVMAKNILAKIDDPILLLQIKMWLQNNRNHQFYGNVYPGLARGGAPLDT